MKIFLSWSGLRSRAIAEALNDWLGRVIQAVEPFYSPDIEKGAKWSGEIDNALEGTSFGIICLTPENLDSNWIHFEAGALSKTKDALIWTFLHGLTPGDVPQPLGKFQHTIAEKRDTLRLLKTINKRLSEIGGVSLTDKLLEETVEMFWSQLEAKLVAAQAIKDLASPAKSENSFDTQRDSREILNEILELARNQERRLADLEERVYKPLEHSLSKKKQKTRGLLTIKISADEIDDVAAVARDLSAAIRGLEPDATTTIIKFGDTFILEVDLDDLPSSRVSGLVKRAGALVDFTPSSWDYHQVPSVPVGF